MPGKSTLASLAGVAVLLPALALAGGLVGGSLRLEPAPPVATVQATAGDLRLAGLLGQPAAQRAADDGLVLHSGFHTPDGDSPGDAIFSDGFEERP